MAAGDAVKILRASSCWMPSKPFFDAQELEKLVSIVAEEIIAENMTSSDLDNLIERTIFAVEHLAFSTSLKTKPARDRLAKFSGAAEALEGAWRGLGHHLQQSLLISSEGRLGFTRPAAAADTIMVNHDRAQRIKQTLNGDLGPLARDASALVKILSKRRVGKPFELICVFTIASAWYDCTKHVPTLSRNNEVVSGSYETRFQRYLAKATSVHPMGPGIVQTAIDAFRASLENDEGRTLGA